ncbi:MULTISPECIES: hypothetical protein [unclassified Lysinibacillus]
MNESGYSFVETILSVVIVMLVCTTLIPISYIYAILWGITTAIYQRKIF